MWSVEFARFEADGVAGRKGRTALVDDGFKADDCELSGGDCGSCDQAEDDCPEEGLDGLDRLEGECKWGVGIVEPGRRGGGHGNLSRFPQVVAEWWNNGSGSGSDRVSTIAPGVEDRTCRGLSDEVGRVPVPSAVVGTLVRRKLTAVVSCDPELLCSRAPAVVETIRRE